MTDSPQWVVDVTVFYADGEPGDLQVVVAAARPSEAEAEAKARVQRATGRPAEDIGVNRVEARRSPVG